MAAAEPIQVATDSAHPYHLSLYEAMGDGVQWRQLYQDHLRRDDLADRLAKTDVFHLHWPEWFVGDELALADRFIAALDATSTPLVWTQHNLVPHWDDPAHLPLYERIAARADAVIHHSAWGRERALAYRPYRPDARHEVIAHGHWGHLMEAARSLDRDTAAAALGLAPAAIRIGIVGAPRRDKHVQRFMDAFAATSRADLALVVLCLDEHEHAPDDPRITAWPYEYVDRAIYDQRLAALDVVALPFDPDGQMLTTGVVGDVVGLGLPALVSDWAYLTESLGEAGIVVGSTASSITAALEALQPADLARAAALSRALQAPTAWPTLAEQTLRLHRSLLI